MFIHAQLFDILAYKKKEKKKRCHASGKKKRNVGTTNKGTKKLNYAQKVYKIKSFLFIKNCITSYQFIYSSNYRLINVRQRFVA